ncbi:MAG: HAD hydrolase-like protein [Planctomycetota bacterium]
MLILFDIDQTLLSVRGAGMRALGTAGSFLFGGRFETGTVDYAGRLDPLIVADLLRANGLEPTADRVRSLRAAYAEAFAQELDRLSREPTPLALPGATELVAALQREPGRTLGVLTGNYEETGTAKLLAAGFDMSSFSILVWGDQSPHEPPHRDHLPGVAMERWDESDPSRAVIIGDTPHDVRCARTNGMRCIAVTTGHSDAASLHDAGADLVLESLEDTEGVIAWMGT